MNIPVISLTTGRSVEIEPSAIRAVAPRLREKASEYSQNLLMERIHKQLGAEAKKALKGHLVRQVAEFNPTRKRI